VPAYTTFDLSGRYETKIAGDDVTFRAGMNSLTDRRYWTTEWGYLRYPVGNPHVRSKCDGAFLKTDVESSL